MRCVPARDFTVSKAMAWRSAIADDPPYQRASGVWTLAKRQLFIDSLLNGYDVPKIYLHDLRGKHPTRVYAVVDGKQRLSTIWEYLADGFGLAENFRIEEANLPDLPDGVLHPRAGQRFSQLDPAWQRVLRSTYLAVVLIQNATPADIEDLFSRLNNGEPLNAAERRNALGGDVMKLAREVAGHPLFVERTRFSNARYGYLDAATRIVVIEWGAEADPRTVPDLRASALDAFIREHRTIPAARRRRLLGRVHAQLDRMCQVFMAEDPLLGSQAAPPFYYLLVRRIPSGASPAGGLELRDFLERFQADRRAQVQRGDEGQDPVLREFTELLRGGAYEPGNLARRLDLLVTRLRAAVPTIAVASDDATGGRGRHARLDSVS